MSVGLDFNIRTINRTNRGHYIVVNVNRTENFFPNQSVSGSIFMFDVHV